MGNKMIGKAQQHLSSVKTEPTVSHIYKTTSEKLRMMFVNPMEQKRDPIEYLKDFGFAKGLLNKTSSDPDSGIIGDDRDLLRRRRHFGPNTKPLAPLPKLFDSVKQTIMEPLWLILLVSAVIASGASMFTNGPLEAIGEAVTIILATFALIAITSLADWAKDRKFVQLQSLIKEDTVTVIRGKVNAFSTISTWDLVVGDVIILNTGAQIPADCLVLTAADLQVSPPNQDVDGNPIHKKPYGGDGYDVDSDPFLHSGSMITRGQCKALVCCVGKDSSLAEESVEKLGTNQDTALQKKLKNLTDQFTLGALYSAVFIFVLLTVRAVIAQSDSGLLVNRIVGFLNIAVVLVVVSVPEGLPLTIGVSLAFSVMTMYQKNILVRKLDAPEKLGGVDEIVCGKTATLTKNKMRVNEFYCEGKHIRNTRNDTFLQCDLSQEAVMRIRECIIYNCEAKVEMGSTTYLPVGNGTEIGLLRFLQDADVPIHLLTNFKYGKTKMISPHTPDRKRSAIALESPERPGKVVIYVKGAPEILLDHCKDMLSTDPQISDGLVAELNESEKASINEKIDKMAGQTTQFLRVIGLAFWEMDMAEWQQQFEADRDSGRSSDRTFEEMMEYKQAKLTWIGAFGLRDPLRVGVEDSIKFARNQAKLGVRLVSGDHLASAKAAALRSGILLPHEASQPYAVMTGQEFRSTVGTIQRTHNPTTDQVEETIENLDVFSDVADQLRVLARATPFDKAVLVCGLKCLGKSVAVTGEGISDVAPLKISDVGVAMGSGCSAAIHSSDIVLTNDDFEATVQSIKWGRNIFHNISRFLQFQVTVNISCLLTMIIGGIFLAESPFTPVQLLWMNLIMDTFAAIALSTEPPVDSVTSGLPFKGNAAVLSASVWRQILGISFWNMIVMIFMFIKMAADPNYRSNVDTAWAQDTDTSLHTQEQIDGATAKLDHLTKIFHTFIFLQLFNQINCRKVGRQDFNVFEEFFHNNYFIAVLFGTAGFQVILGTYLCDFVGCVRKSDISFWGNCILMGSTNLVASAVLKLLPIGLVNLIASKLPDTLVNEDREVDSKTLQAWDKVNNLQLPKRGTQDDYYGEHVEDDEDRDYEKVDNDFKAA